jgi:hypothetical protein
MADPITDYPNNYPLVTYGSRAITDGVSDADLPDVPPMAIPLNTLNGNPLPELTDTQNLTVNGLPEVTD